MPEMVGLIAAIASLAGTGVGLGETLANKPGAPKPITPSPAVTDANAAQTAMNQKALTAQQFPGEQERTGGSLAPDVWVQLAQMITGQAGTPGISGINADLIKQISGGGGSTVSAGYSGGGTPGITPGLTNTTFG